jgi:hypothetical protein
VTAPARFTQADLRRAAAGVRAAGLPVARVEVDREGKISVIVGDPEAEASGRNPLDRILDDAT